MGANWVRLRMSANFTPSGRLLRWHVTCLTTGVNEPLLLCSGHFLYKIRLTSIRNLSKNSAQEVGAHEQTLMYSSVRVVLRVCQLRSRASFPSHTSPARKSA